MKDDKLDNRIINNSKSQHQQAIDALNKAKQQRKGKKYTYVRIDDKTIVEREIKQG